MCGFFFIYNIKQAIGKTKNRTCIHSFGINPWIFTEGKMRPVNKCQGIYQKKFFLHIQYIEIN